MSKVKIDESIMNAIETVSFGCIWGTYSVLYFNPLIVMHYKMQSWSGYAIFNCKRL